MAVVSISARNRSAPTTAASSAFRTLVRQCDLPLVPEVLGQIDRRPPTFADLSLDAVAAL